MPQTLIFKFEELPLIVEDGWRVGLLNGEAEINFYNHGEWFVGSIWLEAFKDGKCGLREIESTRFYRDIWSRLTDEEPYKSQIADAVIEELAEQGITPRSDAQEHGTLHKTYQGV